MVTGPEVVQYLKVTGRTLDSLPAVIAAVTDGVNDSVADVTDRFTDRVDIVTPHSLIIPISLWE